MFFRDHFTGNIIDLVRLAQESQFLTLYAFFIFVGTRFRKLMIRDGGFELLANRTDPLAKFGDLTRLLLMPEPNPGSSLVNQVECFFRKVSTRQELNRSEDRSFDRDIIIYHFVVLLVIRFDAK